MPSHLKIARSGLLGTLLLAASVAGQSLPVPLIDAAFAVTRAAITISPALFEQDRFRAPFETPGPAVAPRPDDCGPMPEPIASLETEQPYKSGDRTFSRIDERKEAARNAASASVREMTSALAPLANRYMASDGEDRRSGACALILLERWASADALRDVATHDAQFIRTVALAGWTVDYAQVRHLRLSDGADPHPTIQAWFRRMGEDLRDHYSGITNVTGRNNHRAWAGLAATGLALGSGDEPLMEWGVESARIALDEVDSDGSMPLEIARRARARHYHLYAAAPLVMTAEIAAANGEDLYGYRDGALHRLVAFTLAAVNDPDRIARMAGAAQQRPIEDARRYTRQYLAWAEFYARRHSEASVELESAFAERPLVNPELGGNLSMLARNWRR